MFLVVLLRSGPQWDPSRPLEEQSDWPAHASFMDGLVDAGFIVLCGPLAGGERPVNDLVRLLGLAQPQVSKHLRVLREVGAVDVREEGRQRLYRLNGHALKPIHDWVKNYERSWSERFSRMDAVLEELKQEEEGDGSDD